MQNMNPSEMTHAQMGKISDLLTAGLRKAGLQSEPTQVVIETQGASLTDELVEVIRKHVEGQSNLIVRRVKVNRNRTPKQVLDATCQIKYVNDSVVDAMPHGECDEVEVVFFKPNKSAYDKNGNISDDDLEKQFKLHGLKPADPYSVATVNEADPAFADDKPHGTHWKDSSGKWCVAIFSRWIDGPRVEVRRGGCGWRDRDDWSFACLRK